MRLEDVLSGVMSAPRQERCSQARLQIVLVCPIFLERILAHSGRPDSLSSLLQTNRMLALLVGVTEADITDQHKTGECRYKFTQLYTLSQERSGRFCTCTLSTGSQQTRSSFPFRDWRPVLVTGAMPDLTGDGVYLPVPCSYGFNLFRPIAIR